MGVFSGTPVLEETPIVEADEVGNPQVLEIEGETEEFIDVVIPPDEDSQPPSKEGSEEGSSAEIGTFSSSTAFLNEMKGILRSFGMPNNVSVSVKPVVCGMGQAIGCASYKKIEFASRLSGYSTSWKRFVAAHEYAHVVQLDQWSPLLANSKYKSLYRSDIEHLADCMAATKGAPMVEGRKCTSAQLSFARDVWNYKIDPRANPSYKALSTGVVKVTGETAPGHTLKATASHTGGYGKVSTTYQWKIGGKVVGTSSSYKIKSADAGKNITATITKKDTYTTSSRTSASLPIYKSITRLSGPNRYQTNYAVNKKYAVKGKPVFVATGQNYADALSVAPAVVKTGGNLFLTSPKQSKNTVREVNALSPSRVYLIGGSKLTPNSGYKAPVTRISGKDRYETSLKVAEKFFPDSDRVFVATGRNYPDALSGGGVAGRLDAPMLLAPKNSLPAHSREYLKKVKPEEAVVLGGTGAVSGKVVTELRRDSKKVTRLSGSNRYKTNTAVNAYSKRNGGSMSRVFITTGANYPDALSISAPSANGAILLSGKSCVPEGRDILRNASEIILVGGKGAVPGTILCN